MGRRCGGGYHDLGVLFGVLAALQLGLASARGMGEGRYPSSQTASNVKVDLYDPSHGVVMGVPNDQCDDAQTNLFVDWCDANVTRPQCAQAYTCFNPQKPIVPNKDVDPEYHEDYIDDNYTPQHHCMDKVLTYTDDLPTYGDHRPLWPKFGEYIYVPTQRWLHNIEHGAVVMLYHPCAHHRMVHQLRTLVKSCVRKYIITPSSKVPLKRPLALIAWGHRMTMAHVEKDKVVKFIKSYGIKGPEGWLPKEGQYTLALKELAVPPPGSDMSDSVICPNL